MSNDQNKPLTAEEMYQESVLFGVLGPVTELMERYAAQQVAVIKGHAEAWQGEYIRANKELEAVKKDKANAAAFETSKKNAELMAKNQWISVEDRLPEELVAFIGIIPAQDNHIAVMVYEKKEGMYLDYDGTEITDPVTHWMPLPAPPESLNGKK